MLRSISSHRERELGVMAGAAGVSACVLSEDSGDGVHGSFGDGNRDAMFRHTAEPIETGTQRSGAAESGTAHQPSTRARKVISDATYASHTPFQAFSRHKHACCGVRPGPHCAQRKDPWSLQLARAVPLPLQQLVGLDKRLARASARAEIVAIERELRASRAARTDAAVPHVVQV